jgi:hypothetical protein
MCFPIDCHLCFSLLKRRLQRLRTGAIKRDNMKRFTGLLRRDDELTDLK